MNVKRLFWDLETSPNIGFFWHSGYKININYDNIIRERAIICACYKWEDSEKVDCLQWDDGDDSKLLEELSVILGTADELVAHNGDKFDMRWFNGRNLIHNLAPVPRYKTVDTLKLAKRHFFLNSNRLDYLSKILLGEGKMHTDFNLWRRIVLNNDLAAMSKMVEYCKRDVVLLEQIWKKLSEYEEPMTHAGVVAGNERWTCPRCGTERVKKNKTRISRKGITSHQMQCLECGGYYTITDFVFRKYKEAKYEEFVHESLS